MREEGGRIVLMDFGAGREHLEEAIGGDGDLAGTPVYLAPELWRGAEANPRSDIYSLGVLLLLPGRPRPTRSAVERCRRCAMRTPPDGTRCSATNGPTCLTRTIDVVERSLTRDPAERYESAGAFEAGLKHAQSSIAPQSGTAMVSTSTPTRPRGSAPNGQSLLLAAERAWDRDEAAGAVSLNIGHTRSRWSGGSGASSSNLPVGIAASTSQRQGGSAAGVQRGAWTPLARWSVFPIRQRQRRPVLLGTSDGCHSSGDHKT